MRIPYLSMTYTFVPLDIYTKVAGDLVIQLFVYLLIYVCECNINEDDSMLLPLLRHQHHHHHHHHHRHAVLGPS
jgi:hypothetical protein